MGGATALDGRKSRNKSNNQPKNSVNGGGCLRWDDAAAECMGGGIFVLFWGIKVCDKNYENKIRRGIRQPPDDKEHTTINQKMQWDGGGMGQDEQQGEDARGEQINDFGVIEFGWG